MESLVVEVRGRLRGWTELVVPLLVRLETRTESNLPLMLPSHYLRPRWYTQTVSLGILQPCFRFVRLQP